jgi:putative ABC transport system permease protein
MQIGLSLLLLVGAGLFMRTLGNLKSTDLGFIPERLITFQVDPGLAGYPKEQQAALYGRVLERLRAIPGVRSVGGTSSAEMRDNNNTSNITVAGYTEKPEEDMNVQRTRVSEEYLPTLQVPVLAGRGILEQDNAADNTNVVVNESFAKYFYGDPRKAVGRAFGWGGGNGTKLDQQIVGVVRDSKHNGVRGAVSRTVFEPYLHDNHFDSMAFYIRTSQEAQSAQGAVRMAMQNLDSKLTLGEFRTMEEQIEQSLSLDRIIAQLAAGFAVLALFMAAVGLYGVLAYSTAQRTREIGVRIALGSSRLEVLKLVLTEVLWLAGAGIAVSLPLTLLLARTLKSQLYGISSNDPLTIIAVVVLLAGVALFSASIPARRAAKVDPMVALRYE